MPSLAQPVHRKIDGYRRRLKHEYYMWSCDRTARRNARKYEKWMMRLRQNPPEVLIGTNFPAGGVHHHLHAIRRHSALRLELAPPEELADSFGTDLRQMFIDYTPANVRAIHSHVMPWFIEWCRNKQQSGIRWVHTYHNMYWPEFARGELFPWQKEINEALINVACHADARVSVARWQQRYLLTTHKITTIYIPNGVEVALCDRADEGRFQRKFGRENFVLYVGRNDPVKNPEDFVRLAIRLPRQRFIMIGHGLNQAVVRKEWNLEVPGNLSIVGAASHAQVQDAIAACSALVVTSKREGLPTLVLEAMAHQKPIVVPDEAGCMEAIGDGDFGFIYSRGNIDDLANNTLKALTDTQSRQAARQRILSEYDWRVVVPKLDALYRNDPASPGSSS